MANPVFSPPVPPSVGSEPDNEIRLNEANFGDGYRQVTVDGLNARRVIWSLAWQTLTRVQADAIVDFLNAREGAGLFNWTPPGYVTAMQFRCPKWSPPKPEQGDDVFRVIARFEEVFDLG